MLSILDTQHPSQSNSLPQVLALHFADADLTQDHQNTETRDLLHVPASILGEISSLLGHINDYKALAGTCTILRDTLVTAPTAGRWLLRCSPDQALLTAAVMGWVSVVRWLATANPTSLLQQGFTALTAVCLRRCCASLPMLDALLHLGAHRQALPLPTQMGTIFPGLKPCRLDMSPEPAHAGTVNEPSRKDYLLLSTMLSSSNMAGMLLGFFKDGEWCMDDETCGSLLALCIKHGNATKAALVMQIRPVSAARQTGLLLLCCSSGRRQTLTTLLQHFLPHVRLTTHEPQYQSMSHAERQREIMLHQLKIGVDPVIFSQHLQQCVDIALQSGFPDVQELLLLQQLEELAGV